MANIEELKQQEIKNLNDGDLEIFELESLITGGTDEKIPIEITYNGKTFGASIRPLNNIEWNNASQIAFKNKKTTSDIEILKLGLYNKDGTKFPNELIEKLPAGIVSTIMKEIARVSGVNFNSEENLKLMKKLMGF